MFYRFQCINYTYILQDLPWENQPTDSPQRAHFQHLRLVLPPSTTHQAALRPEHPDAVMLWPHHRSHLGLLPSRAPALGEASWHAVAALRPTLSRVGVSCRQPLERAGYRAPQPQEVPSQRKSVPLGNSSCFKQLNLELNGYTATDNTTTILCFLVLL